MAALPFKVVAILEPSLSLTHPDHPQLDRQMKADLATWLAHARRGGADAVYARTQRMQPAAARSLLEAIAAEFNLLAPDTAFDPELPVLGWHHTRHSITLIPPGPWLRGRSCHSLDDLLAAEREGIDYAFLSPVFSTATHPDAPPLGLEVLEATCRRTKIPLIALGGVTAATAAACLQAGAAGWAGIGAFR